MYTYEYDAEGNRTKRTRTADGSFTEYIWNHANLLEQVVEKTAAGTVTKTVTYRYDALGRRIGKSVDDNGDGSADRSESYVYDGAGLLASSAGAIHIGGANGAIRPHGWVDDLIFVFEDTDGSGPASQTRYLHGPAVDQVFASEDATGEILWALGDHQNTPKDWADFDNGTSQCFTVNSVVGEFDSAVAWGSPLLLLSRQVPGSRLRFPVACVCVRLCLGRHSASDGNVAIMLRMMRPRARPVG